MLIELHVAHDHWNFADIAARYGLTMPTPPPQCWACLLAKPKLMSHDKISTRKASRPFEGIAADAKGPISQPTPEGYLYFFVLVCLFSHYHWVFLAKSQGDWADLWETFVLQLEARVLRVAGPVVPDSLEDFSQSEQIHLRE